MNYLRRFDAVTATKTRFLDQPLDWGRCDCLKLVGFCLGLIRDEKPLKGVSYTSRTGALRAMRKARYASLAEAVDGYGLERITPASALPGDIIGLPTDDEAEAFGDYALGVLIAADQVLAFAETPAGDRVATIGPLGLALSMLPDLTGRPVIAWRAI